MTVGGRGSEVRAGRTKARRRGPGEAYLPSKWTRSGDAREVTKEQIWGYKSGCCAVVKARNPSDVVDLLTFAPLLSLRLLLCLLTS